MPTTPHSRSRRRCVALAAVALLSVVPLAACSDDSGEPAMAADAEVAPGEPAAKLALEQERTVIDVRSPEEYAEAHVEGSANLDIQSADFPEAIAGLDPDGAYVVYCRTGNRSAQAADEMDALGLEVIDGGGLTDMQAAGWPIA